MLIKVNLKLSSGETNTYDAQFVSYNIYNNSIRVWIPELTHRMVKKPFSTENTYILNGVFDFPISEVIFVELDSLRGDLTLRELTKKYQIKSVAYTNKYTSEVGGIWYVRLA